ncbi:hypothetical protein HANVADRAFT_51330 [Hanseniaspora valbyensis NRRL Y-1626]|uniref:Uncharacterized protein n=1 Tax=Hanseniaspora valbyensis NRRL Y-1626 TaxID=766949 RepID=A0A1B7TJJ9_9ASCO|nr:hypothetical protein HANVADRAFT_51330 [Hanseniaspora valbyensis NRRL Y-1626]
MESNSTHNQEEDISFMKNLLKQLLVNKLDNDNKELDTLLNKSITELDDKYKSIIKDFENEGYNEETIKKEAEDMKLYTKEN